MSELRVIAMQTEMAVEVRKTMASPGYGPPATVSVAKGHGPCRHCLEPFVVGEDRRTLFTMNTFAGMEAVPQPGPVFVHERECRRYAEDDGYPERLLQFGAVLDGYDAARLVAQRVTVLDASQGVTLQGMFEDETIRYVIVQDAKAGCYDFRVERMN